MLSDVNKAEPKVKAILYLIFGIAMATGMYVISCGIYIIPTLTVVNPSIDNEFRFFSVFWMSYGIFTFWVSRNLTEEARFVPFIGLVFFLAGVARSLSVLLVGAPINLLVAAIVVELVLPLFLWLFYARYKKQLSPLN